MRAILERDYLAEARKPRAFAARTAPGLFGALVIVFGTLAGGTLAGRDYDRIGSEAFEALSVALFVFLLLTTPFLLVGSLLPERQGNTLEILLATPEGARGRTPTSLWRSGRNVYGLRSFTRRAMRFSTVSGGTARGASGSWLPGATGQDSEARGRDPRSRSPRRTSGGPSSAPSAMPAADSPRAPGADPGAGAASAAGPGGGSRSAAAAAAPGAAARPAVR